MVARSQEHRWMGMADSGTPEEVNGHALVIG